MGQVHFKVGQVKWLAPLALGQVLKKSICLPLRVLDSYHCYLPYLIYEINFVIHFTFQSFSCRFETIVISQNKPYSDNLQNH